MARYTTTIRLDVGESPLREGWMATATVGAGRHESKFPGKGSAIEAIRYALQQLADGSAFSELSLETALLNDTVNGHDTPKQITADTHDGE